MLRMQCVAAQMFLLLRRYNAAVKAQPHLICDQLLASNNGDQLRSTTEYNGILAMNWRTAIAYEYAMPPNLRLIPEMPIR